MNSFCEISNLVKCWETFVFLLSYLKRCLHFRIFYYMESIINVLLSCIIRRVPLSVLRIFVLYFKFDCISLQIGLLTFELSATQFNPSQFNLYII